jgi:predicted lipoprotein with Yx(FWY)xxD motif
MNRLLKTACMTACVGGAMLLAPASVPAQDMPVKKADGMLVSSRGMSVYTFDKDTPDKSACSDQCAQLWPPVTVAKAPADKGWTAVKRGDGSMQLAYDGKPLYLYSGDQKPGDRLGDNVKGVWHLAKD